MRAAAIQLNSTADKARNLERARRASSRRPPRRRRARRAAREVEPARRAGGARRRRRGARAGPTIAAAARLGARARHQPGRRQHRRAGRGRGAPLQHLVPDRPATARCVAVYRKIHMFDVDVGGVSYRESDARAAGRGDRQRRGRRGRGRADRSATTCAFPSSTGSSRSRGARVITVPSAFTLDHRARPLGGAAARPGDREPGVRDRRQPVRRGAAALQLLRPLDDRRPVGRGARRRRPTGRASSPPTSTSTVRSEIRETLPSLANRRPRPTAGPSRREAAGRDGQGAAGRPPPPDPRRRDPRLRPPGLPRLPRLRHRPRGERRIRARLPLLRLQGPGAQRALRRALVAAAAGDRGGRRAADPAAREARCGRRVHHRLLPPRPRADEGDHRRGHAGGELVRPHPPAGDPPGLRPDREDRPRRPGERRRSATTSTPTSPRCGSTARSSSCSPAGCSS